MRVLWLTLSCGRSLLYIGDLSITQYDKLGISLAEPINDEDSKIEHRSSAVRDGRNFQVIIDPGDINPAAAFLLVSLPAGAFQHAAPADVRAVHFSDDAAVVLKTNAVSNILRLELVKEEPSGATVASNPSGPAAPEVVSLVRVADTVTRGPDQGGSGFFSLAAVSGPFNVKVTFTEEPHDAITDIIAVQRGKVTSVVKGSPFYSLPDASEGNYSTDNLPATPPLTTGRDRRYHSYLLTIAPNLAKADETVEVAVKGFDDLVIPANSWTPPGNLSLAHNRYLLIVPVATGATRTPTVSADNAAALAALVTGKFLPEGLVVQAGKYLVLTVGDAAQSGVQASTATLKDKKGAAVDYNVSNGFTLPYPGDDLSTFFRNGGTIELSHNNAVGNTGKDAATGRVTSETQYESEALVISEIMWGRDASLGNADATKSQWIELYNPGGADISIDLEEWILAFYSGPAPATPPAIPAVVATAATATTAAVAAVAAIPFTVVDTVSNSVPYWPAPGMDGATVASRQVDVIDTTDDDKPIVGAVVEDFVRGTLVSMYRKIDGATVSSGTSADSWAASSVAGTRNLSGLRAGTPGAATPYTAPEDPTDPADPAEPTAPVATVGDLMISEIMVSSNEGRLPQWIEIANDSAGEVSLEGWVIGIDNDSADADVIATSIGIKLDGVVLDAGHTALVVSKTSNRNSGIDVVVDSGRIVDAQAQVNPPTATYSLLSEMAFRISLEPPLAGGIIGRSDVVGNLGGGWELPASEGARSSIIRREMGDAGEIMGTDAAGWVLASDTGDSGYAATYYGDKDDIGTPGYDAGGALPVELSKFGAKRDPLTGQSIITWETQSELNNAGFFIKRSQQKDGKFQVINPTMIAGAGTTAEKQSYTYTDATADPNIVYYYQIEDVSLDGNRQTLTRSHRLKGHVGAAGKATTMWGELKEQQ